MARGHAEALMPLIAAVMQKSGLQYEDLDRIAVTVGPGCFTGLRVGIAAARGIALAAGKPAIGLSTLAALAAPFIAADDSGAGRRRDRCPPPPCLSAIVRSGRPHAGVAALCRCAMPFDGSLRRSAVSSARWRRCWRHPGRTMPSRRRSIERARARHRLGRAARRRAHETSAPPKPLYLRAPDAQPQAACWCRADETASPICSAARAGAVGGDASRDAAAIATLHARIVSARLERGRVRALAARSLRCSRIAPLIGGHIRRLHYVALRRR